MNNQIINTFIAVLFSAVSIFASHSEPSITTNGTKSFIINHKDWKSEFVDVVIADNDGITVYSNSESLIRSKKFSLENLQSGDYTVTISNELKTIENKITITKDELFLDFNATIVYKPVINLNENTIDINYLSAGADTELVLQSNDNVWYDENIKDNMTISKRFDISNLPSGEYSIVVSNKTGTFTKEFTR